MRSRISSGNAGAVIDDLDLQGQTVAFLDQGDLAHRPGAQDDRPLPPIAWAALRAMLRNSLDELLRSPTNSGRLVS